MLGVYAFGFGVNLILETVDGFAREGGDEDDGYRPRNYHPLHNVRGELGIKDGEDSAVKGEDGEFGR